MHPGQTQAGENPEQCTGPAGKGKAPVLGKQQSAPEEDQQVFEQPYPGI
jgi:hypothetical protein